MLALISYDAYFCDAKKWIVINMGKSTCPFLGDRAFASGDIMVMDELGFVYFRDRIGDTFRWKGENVSTAEVEAVVMDALGYAEDVAVYGVSIPGTEGRAGMAAIHLVLDGGEEDGAGEDQRYVGNGISNGARNGVIRLNSNQNVIGRGKVDLEHLAKELKCRLPPYAVPVFLRLLWSPAEATGTFKIKKAELKAAAYDLNKVAGTDQIFFLHPRTGDYTFLEASSAREINNGDLRF